MKSIDKKKNVVYNAFMANIALLNTTEITTPTLTQSFAGTLATAFRDEFRSVHLSGQLLRSIRVEADGDDNYRIEIPPQIYDIAKYKRTGIVVPISNDSYALKVNITGGLSGLHKDYIEKCIMRAFIQWQKINGLKPENLKMDITKWGN